MRILLVEDDEEIAVRLARGLKAAGFIVDRASNGDDGYMLGRDQKFDAAILDLGLPGMDGLSVLQMWRAENVRMPVLILTARGTLTEKVKGLNAGADDYIAKPFHTPEIVARLHALTRRSSGAAHPLLSHRNIALDTISGKATVHGRSVALTALELRMLTYFLLRVGRIVTQEELAEHLYGVDDSAESNTIEVYIARLRKKLGRDLITTVRGLGYRMD
ncbi:MAG: response regulator transcription factor [Hyphomicrobium sp.]|nr:response regulator transcription factor [Hyphomicrobium sp.]KAB2943532.1 MAG: response regulator transcription factor [Hyphomicrobium sp.]MBZ0209757.1 response regulator transcription factor [Hyphomicrobium sp.]